MARTDSVSGSRSAGFDVKELRTNRRKNNEENDKGFLSRAERRERREERKNSRQVSTQPVSDPVPVTTTPVTSTPTEPSQPSTPTPSSPAVTTLRSAAERYVDTYTKNSGRTFSTDEREAKIQEVQDFYGESSQRQDRLISLANRLTVA